MIHIGADHRGYELKEELVKYLQGKGYQVADEGTNSEESVDYPLIAQKVAMNVTKDPNNRGILLCGSSVGICMAANKFKGIRAAQAWNEEVAKMARSHTNANVLCVSADSATVEETEKIVQKFLDTSFSGEERHKRRLAQIDQIEKEN